MTLIRTYKTAHSLLISYFDVVEQLSISSTKKFSLSSSLVKTQVHRSLKLSVFNGKLFVSSYEKNGDSTASVSELSPQHPGLIMRFIHPETKELINAFLSEHFDIPEIKEFSMLEKSSIEEMRFYNKYVKEEEKIEIAYLLVKMLSLCFPVYINFLADRVSDGYYSDFSPSPQSRKYAGAKNYREFIMILFGTYRKDLAKVALACNAVTLDWAYQFKGLIEVDHIINGLRDSSPAVGGATADNFDVLRGFPAATVAKLFLDGFKNTNDFTTIRDALEMAPSIPVAERKLCKTWKELHDRGVMHYVHDEDGYKEIFHPREFEDFFEKADFGKRKVVPLRNSEEFIKTGKYMDVCVGSLSYITRAFEGEGYCFRVDNSEKEKYALVEVIRKDESWKIEQVKGNSNQDLPKTFHSELFNELSKYIKLESRK